MCGITGWIDWERDLTQEKELLEKMTQTLAHRGPDASGLYLTQAAALGHRRLSVIDPERGAQPMTRNGKNNSYTIVYNGELYNTQELRTQLLSRGYSFETHSDTEVLLYSYIEWGKDCVERLNGIFAFGVWDERERTLFLARDRLGVKPLFYTIVNKKLIFGSELKALLAHPLVKPELDHEGLGEIFALGPARTPGHGVFKNIKEVRPGFYLIFNEKGTFLHRYWELESMPHEDDLPTTIEKVRYLLEDSVERQLVSDVPLCTMLSGGLDSSALTSFASSHYKEKGLGQLQTYSIDYFDNEDFFQPSLFQPTSDKPWVEKVSAYLDTQHHYKIFDTPQLVEALEMAVWSRDLPGMADVDSSLYLFCKEIKKDATVALSGECADEVFGGYPWFYNEETLQADTFPWARNQEARAKILSPEVLKRVNPVAYLEQRYAETLQEVPYLKGETHREAKRREMFYLNITWFMNTLLDRKDRMSMAAGLEVRVPFCDHRLVEYVWNIPWEMKFYQDREKGVLRKALEDILPSDVIWRKKSPYPKTHNPSYLKAVRERLAEIIADKNSPLRSLMNVKYIRGLLNSDLSNFNDPWFGQLMTGPQLFAYLIQVDIWLRKYQVVVK